MANEFPAFTKPAILGVHLTSPDAKLIRDNSINIKNDGTARLNMEYFNFVTGLTMTNNKFSRLFSRESRAVETDILRSDMDLATSVQQVTEEIILKPE